MPFLPHLEYMVYYDHIVQHECVNRDNPDIDCDGACYLEKKIHDVQDKHEHEAPQNQERERPNIIPIVAVPLTFSLEVNRPSDSDLTIHNLSIYHNSPFLNSIFRPPQV